MKRIVPAILIALGLLVAAFYFYHKNTAPNPADSRAKSYSLREEWIPWMGYTGGVVANAKGYFGADFTLDIRPGGLESDPIKLVASGVDTFGVAGAERVAQAVEKGAPLVIIGSVNYRSPTVFVTLKKSGITEPAQWVGKKVGVLSGSNTEVVYRALLAKLGIKKDSFQEVEISFDLPAFIRGTFDVLPAFAYDEPITLRNENVEIHVLDPSSHGITAMGNVYFTTREMVETHPDVVQAFITGVLKGWTYAFAHPDESIGLLAAVDSKLDLAKEKESLLAARPYFEGEGHRLLEFRREDIQAEIEMLRSIGELGPSLDADGFITTKFVENAHR